MSEFNTPQVSVCIPVYNCEKYIGQAIESVLAQTFFDWELIILDNSSSDNTLDFVKSYSDARIRVIESDKNLGMEANWNKALTEAKGHYIKLLPADDYLLPNCLEKQVEIFDRPGNKTVVLISSGRNIIDQSGNLLIKRTFPGKEGFIKGYTAIRRVIRAGTNLLGEPGAILFKREVLRQAGQFDGSLIYVIDVDLWTRILLLGDLYVIHEPLSAFRLSSGSCSVEVTSLQSEQFSVFITNLSHNPLSRTSRFDVYHGIIMSKVLALGRRFFYLITVRKATREGNGKN